jgi:hypothetical protein
MSVVSIVLRSSLAVGVGTAIGQKKKTVGDQSAMLRVFVV